MKKIYNVLDISRYIINKSIEMGNPINNLKLQKLLYYTQAEFLVRKGEPAFKEEIVAWKYGPVVVEAYEEFKTYSSGKIIEKIITKDVWDIDDSFKLRIKKKNVDPYNKITSIEDVNMIDKIIELYKEKESLEMTFSIKKEKIYIESYNNKKNNIIKKEKIKEFFSIKTNKYKIGG